MNKEIAHQLATSLKHRKGGESQYTRCDYALFSPTTFAVRKYATHDIRNMD